MVKDSQPYCLDLERQIKLVEKMRDKGFHRDHPLVANPLKRAIVIRQAADHAGHHIPDYGPCDDCKAKGGERA